MTTLRDYQTDATGRLRAEASRLRAAGLPPRVLLQSETGSGKTVMAASLMAAAAGKGKKALFVARGRELVKNCVRELAGFGVHAGVMMAGEDHWPHAACQVASRDTFLSWVFRRNRVDAPAADLVVIDECREATTAAWAKILGHYRGAVVVGLDATPARSDGRGLGNVFGALVQSVPRSTLIARGFLVPTRVFAPHVPNLKGLHTRGGDWVRSELAKRLDRPSLVGDVIGNWKDQASDRRTVVFACDIRHSMHLRDEFLAAGVAAAHLDKDTDPVDRDRVTEDLQHGGLQVVCNVGVYKQGVDLPPVSCVVLARPTKSFVLYRQMVGRGGRPHAGKADCVVLDHAGAVFAHGHPDDDVEWTLDCAAGSQAGRRSKDARPVARCPKCHAVFTTGGLCPNCGAKAKKPTPREHEFAQGKLVELGLGGELAAMVLVEQQQRHWHKCLAVAANRGQTVSAALAMYRQKYKSWPDRALRNVPGTEHLHTKVSELYPQYLRRPAS